MYVIQPAHSWWRKENWNEARPLPEGFRYSSDGNTQWLTREELYELVDESSPVLATSPQEPYRLLDYSQTLE